MFGVFHRRAMLCSNLNITITITRTPSFLQHFSSSKQHSFTTNYLINNLTFSPETASKLSTRVRLKNSDQPNSVLALFRTHGFSNTQLSKIIQTFPKLLSFNPNKTVLPKFNFLLSKGASTSDLVQIVTKNPSVLKQGLANTITPCYDFLKRFLVSDESTIYSIKYCPCLIYSKLPSINVQLLLQNGVPESRIAFLLRSYFYSACKQPDVFKKVVEEVKGLGFNPKSTHFIVAVTTKLMGSSLWERKVDLYKKWGWSEEVIGSAFLRNPCCMWTSMDKIEAVMEFWVNGIGWDSLMLAKYPVLFTSSLEKKIIPRAFVLQFLQSRGLIKDVKSAPFKLTDDMFLQKFVNCFEEEASHLLKLYEEKMYQPRHENASLSYFGFEDLNK
ncbi:uncharacterized protein LOC130726669 [Lotus japonicus]|uniref:uncharacterized protein LOC130726669 n=1 Tax=Lotus japonicus TaxID=34305 RepID=UPI00258E6FFE|nr:uncharacterized protein LOC130726669 [Lotus japonicus]